MRVLTKEQPDDGKTVITVETEVKCGLLWLKKRKVETSYEAQEESPTYWLKLPNRELIDNRLSSQLDAWNKYYKVGYSLSEK